MKKKLSDQFSLDSLIKIANGDQVFIREMISLFLEKAPITLREINESYEAGDYTKLEAKAHKLKSSIQIIANDPLHQLVVDIEDKAKSTKNKAAFASQIRKLNEQINLLFAFLKNKLNEDSISN